MWGEHKTHTGIRFKIIMKEILCQNGWENKSLY
jgi:hypothetical protein